MTLRTGPRFVTGLVFGLAVVLSNARATAFGSPITVRLLAPRTSRLAEDLHREMTASGFSVVVLESKTTDWRVDARRLVGNDPVRGVVVRADEALMTVFTWVASTGSIQEHLEQIVEPGGDRLARRRACLSVVEYLRVLSENDPPPPIDLGTAPPMARPPAPPATTRGPAQIPPGALSPPPPPAFLPPPPHATSPPPSPPTSSGSSQRVSENVSSGLLSPGSHPNGPAPPAAPGSPLQPPYPAGPATRDGVDSAAGTVPAPESPEPQFPAPMERAWELGVGATLGLQASPGGPTSHLQFLWYLPLEWRLAICVRALWPILAGQFRTDGNDVRVWTFGAALGMQYLMKIAPGRVRPFVGAALGARAALTETTPAAALQSRETFTPSLTLGADAGLRYTLSPLVSLFLEIGVVHGWLVPGVHRAPYEERAANSDSIHASFGVVFEI